MKTKIQYNSSMSILLLFSLMLSCANPNKLIDRGQYDQAIELGVRKLSGKKKKRTKYVLALEEAFSRATKSDMREIEILKREAREENWVEINYIHQQIKRRQKMIEPLLPLHAEDGYKADFLFVRVEDLEMESKEKAAEFYYLQGKKQLALAENGDKAAARAAFNEFEKIKRYFKNYKDEDSLKKRAKELGIVRVLFKMENHSQTILPVEFERELKKMSVRDINHDWKTIHLNQEPGIVYDYHIVMKILAIEVSPEAIKEKEYLDDKTIEEGWEYVLDSKGNVMKDSAGNDIKIPKKVLIKASVFETYQHKAAHVGGQLEYFDNRLRELVHSEAVAVEAIFENYAATYKGDSRALTEESKKKLGNRPLPFPSNESLVLQAAGLLKPVVKDKIAKSKILI